MKIKLLLLLTSITVMCSNVSAQINISAEIYKSYEFQNITPKNLLKSPDVKFQHTKAKNKVKSFKFTFFDDIDGDVISIEYKEKFGGIKTYQSTYREIIAINDTTVIVVLSYYDIIIEKEFIVVFEVDNGVNGDKISSDIYIAELTDDNTNMPLFSGYKYTINK